MNNTAEHPCVWLNGEVIARREARVPALDRGFLYGDGFFETTRVHRGRPVFFERHVRRLNSSCRHAGFSALPDGQAVAEGVRRLVQLNRVEDGYLRITVSRGVHRGRLTELDSPDPTVLIDCRPMDLSPVDAPPAVRLMRSPHRRPARSPTVRHKSLSYQDNALALAEARAAGADEVYFLNSEGLLAEGAITNLFFVRDGRVHTPAEDCGLLPGITRRVVLELCAEGEIPATAGEFAEEDLLRADEAFITNSLRGIARVEAILGHPEAAPFGDQLVRELQSAYGQLVRRSEHHSGGSV